MIRPYPGNRPITTAESSSTSPNRPQTEQISRKQYITDPKSVNYDNEGKWIDYDARVYGGIFGKRPPRTYDAAELRNPNEGSDERGVAHTLTNVKRGFREFGNANDIGKLYKHNEHIPSPTETLSNLSAALATTSIYDNDSSSAEHMANIPAPSVSPMKLRTSDYFHHHHDPNSPQPSPTVPQHLESIGVQHHPERVPPNSLYTSSLIAIETPAFRAQTAHTGKKMVPTKLLSSSLDTTSMIANVPGQDYSTLNNDLNENEVEDSHNITKKVLTEARLGKTAGRNTSSTMNATFYTFPDNVLKENEDDPAFLHPLIPVSSIQDTEGIQKALEKVSAQGTVETLPPRVVNYTNGTTRSIVYVSGVQKDPVLQHRPATTNDRTLSYHNFNIPKDIGVAVRDSHTRAGIVSHVSPKPLVIQEIKQTMTGNVGGGHPIPTLTGSPYGKTSEGIYIRTDMETLAPKVYEPLANNTTSVAGWNTKNMKENTKQLDLPMAPIPFGEGLQHIGSAHMRNNLRLHTGIGTPSPNAIMVLPSPTSVASGLTTFRQRDQDTTTTANTLSSHRNNLIPSPMRVPRQSPLSSSAESSIPNTPLITRAPSDSPTNFIPSPSSSPIPPLPESVPLSASLGVQIPALQLPRDHYLDNPAFATVRFDPAPSLPAAGHPSPVREVAEQSKRTYRAAYTDVHDPRVVEHSALYKIQKQMDDEIDNQFMETARNTKSRDGNSSRSFHSTARSENKGIRYTDIHDAEIYAKSALGYDALRETLYGKEIAYSPEQLALPRGSNLPYPLPTLVGLPYYIKRDAEISYQTTYHHPIPVDPRKPVPIRSTQARYVPTTVRVVGNMDGSMSNTNTYRDRNEPKNYAAAIAQLKTQINAEMKK